MLERLAGVGCCAPGVAVSPRLALPAVDGVLPGLVGEAQLPEAAGDGTSPA